MSGHEDDQGNWTVGLEDLPWEPWMENIDWADPNPEVAEVAAQVGLLGIVVDASSNFPNSSGAAQLTPHHNGQASVAPSATAPSNDNDTAVAIAVDSAAQKRSLGSLSGQNLKCTYPDCTYDKTFLRQWELQRHIASTHLDEKPFTCPVVDCTKHGVPSAFPRSDKLTAHMKAIHSRSDATAVCPDVNCANHPIDLGLLGVHVKLQHLSTKQEGNMGKLLRSVANAASDDKRRCLLPLCKERVDLYDFLSHLISHPSTDLISAEPELVQEGYTLSKLGCEHGSENAGLINEWCGCEVTWIEIVCPACASGHWSRLDLKTHIEESHVWPGEDLSAFRLRILALVGMEATQMLGKEVWADVACQLRPSA